MALVPPETTNPLRSRPTPMDRLHTPETVIMLPGTAAENRQFSKHIVTVRIAKTPQGRLEKNITVIWPLTLPA